MGYTESHACKATHHKAVNCFQIPPKNQQKQNRNKIEKLSKFDIKKGVSS